MTVESNINIDNVFSGHVGSVEHVHEAVGVGVHVGVLLRGGRDLLRVVIYDKKLSVLFPNRVLFFFYSLARIALCKLYNKKKTTSFLDK